VTVHFGVIGDHQPVQRPGEFGADTGGRGHFLP
jgi:hypothetical protein